MDRLYVFVEGTDDARFFDRVLRPSFEREIHVHDPVEYAQQTVDATDGFLRAVGNMDDADYLFFADYDQGPCVSNRVQQVLQTYSDLQRDRLYLVKLEIESWYAAGDSRERCQELGYKWQPRTDELTKEGFFHASPVEEGSFVDFKIEMLEHFDIAVARRRNHSFDYFAGHEL